jgi:uncharacterized protein with von Willebrand factor type A (vWA) domain
MFIDFFYSLKNAGIPVSPTSFLTLQKALDMRLINSLGEFYTSARAILVKSERYFDVYDQVFAHRFEGTEMPEYEVIEIDDISRAAEHRRWAIPGTIRAGCVLEAFPATSRL